MDTTEAQTGAILRANRGVPFCDTCLALTVGVSLETMQAAIGKRSNRWAPESANNGARCVSTGQDRNQRP
jgi:hypothetical protein